MTTDDDARLVMERCDRLGTFSEDEDRLTRRYATLPMRAVNDLVTGWMRAANMRVREDAIGNLIGRYDAAATDAPILVLGSHLDTVCDAGKYDGPLGVMVALACIERLRARHVRLPFAIELVAFADEEGVRYRAGYLGSSFYAGTFQPATLAARDEEDIALAEAMRAFGGDPADLAPSAPPAERLLGYCEVHIEQGPVLEARRLPLGVVSAIQGQSRFTLRFTGMAGHAGTVPPSMRRDALCAASEFVLAVEAQAGAVEGLVATVGQIDAQPGASNVIPGLVALSLDVRHQDDATHERACQALRQTAEQIGQARDIGVDWQEVGHNTSVPCDPRLTALLTRAVAATGHPAPLLPSGAGHDGVSLANRTGIAMLFVRCARGISHNPAESVTTEDVAIAIDALERFLELLADEQTRASMSGEGVSG